MSALQDLTGECFNRWLVLRRSESANPNNKNVYWTVKCTCGTVRAVTGSSLKSGSSKSCGCLKPDYSGRRKGKGRLTHGFNGTRSYAIWRGMIARCENPNHNRFYRYGARGISVCERWSDIANFVADMGEAPPGMSIERKDVNGNYEPENCIWADLETQNNNKVNTKKYLVDGEWRSRAQLSRYWNIKPKAADKRAQSYPMMINGVLYEK